MKYILFILSILLIPNSVDAQSTYIKRLSFNSNPGYVNPQDSILHLRHFAACTDGNSIIEIDMSRGSAKIFKLDLAGNKIWETSGSYHGGNNTYTNVALKATPDGGCIYIMNHYSGSAGVNQRSYLNKIGPMGHIEFSREIPPQYFYGNFYQVGYDVAVQPTGYACLATDSIYLFNMTGDIIGTIDKNGQGKLHSFSDGNLFLDISGFRGKIDTLGNILYPLNYPVVYYDTSFYTIVGNTLHRIDHSNGGYLTSVNFPSSPGHKIQMLADGDWIRYNSNQIFKYDNQGNLTWTKNIPLIYFGINVVGEQSDGTFLTGGTYLTSKYNYAEYDYSTFVGTIDSSGNTIIDSTSQYWTLDANDDSIVEFGDVIYVALAFGSTGPRRVDLAVQNDMIFPGGDIAIDFPGSFANGINHKHSDYVGDGNIDSTDLAMTALLSSQGTYHHTLWRIHKTSVCTILPSFSCIPNQDSITAGDTVRIYFVIGENGIPVDSIFGLAFKLNFDPQNIGNIGRVINMEFIDSDIGNLVDQRTISINNYSAVSMMTGRKDLQNAYMVTDTLGFADIQIPVNAVGNENLLFSVQSFKAITAGGFTVDFQFNSRPVYIRPLINEVSELFEDKIILYPTPVNEIQTLKGLPETELELSIYNYEGKECYSGNTNKHSRISLQTELLSPGIYLLSITNPKGRKTTKKFIKD